MDWDLAWGTNRDSVLSSTTSHTTCGTTPILWPRLSSRQGGTNVSLLSGPCTGIPEWLPSSILASVPTVLCGSTGQFQQGFRFGQTRQIHWLGPLELHPFIISCIMAFNSKPHKFVTNCQ